MNSDPSPPRIDPGAAVSVCGTNSKSSEVDNSAVVEGHPETEYNDRGGSCSRQGGDGDEDGVSTLIFDWDKLCIVDIPDDHLGSTNPVVGEDAIFELLGYNIGVDGDDGHTGDGVQGHGVDGVHAGDGVQGQGHGADGVQGDGDNVQGHDVEIVDVIPSETSVHYDKENPPMEEGSTYGSMAEFRIMLSQHAILNQFEVKTEKAESDRFRGYCKSKKCPWAIVARLTPDEKSAKVALNKFEHSCPSIRKVHNCMASYKWIAEKAVPILKENPNIGAAELKAMLDSKYTTDLTYNTVWVGRNKVMDIIFGFWENSFEMLYRFKAEVELRSPGSVVEIDVQQDGGDIYFHRFFCCFKASIDGFLNGCRPYVSIDSTALNGRWNGHLASAIAIDGHNWMFPVAFGFFDGETTANWTWFMEQLKKAIGSPPSLAISSDACKGLETAVKVVYPWAEHRECFRHLMDNFIKKFQGPVYGNMYPAARAYRADRFDHYMEKINAACPTVGPWLHRYHNLLWTRSKFSEETKCDYITNNLAESWNNWVKELKDLPVAELADAIRKKTMHLYEKRRRLAQKLQGVILPGVVAHLNAMTRGLGKMRVESARNKAEVTEVNEDLQVIRHVVHLDKHECTCREWQVSGKPCPHALAFICTIRNFKMEDYVHPYFSVRSLRMTYAGSIPPLTDKSQWPTVDLGFRLLPPLSKRSAGRHRKNRFLGCLEKGYVPTKSKGKWQVKCKGCGELGHRDSSSKCHLNGTKKRKSRAKKGPKPSDCTSTPRTPRKATRKVPMSRAGEKGSSQTSPGPVTRSQMAINQTAGEGTIHAYSTPTRASKRQRVMSNEASPGPVTRRQLAMSQSAGEGTSQSTLKKKLTPKKKAHSKKANKLLGV